MTTTLTSSTPRVEHDSATSRSETLLRRVLAGNAAFSAVGGLVAIVFGGPLADLVEADAWLVRGIGIALVLFAVDVALVSRLGRPRLSRFAKLIAAADLSWVVATAVVIAAGLVTTAGAIVLGSIGLAVLDFAVVQWRTAARLDA